MSQTTLSPDDAAAHMYPSDLEIFEFGERTATAFSIAVGCPDERSQPLFTTDQAEAYKDACVQEALEWQPIETAPKDGSMILLGRPESEEDDREAISVPGFWQEGWEDSIDDMGCDSGFVDVGFQEFSGGRSFGAEKYRCAPTQPTHWMPMPPPPTKESKND